MADQKKDEEQEKGFVVRDKRFSAKKEEEDVRPKEEAREEEPPAETSKEEPLPEINFINFMLSLSTSALIQLGEIQDPMTKETVKNLPLAKQTIDLIGMLTEKTKGNLSPDEERLMEQILYDLRMRYVKAAT
ncbi:MAG: hypothetical protein A2W09_08480 [Deltaproteobacteria bacterium RBG_16_50_11]|nr:MAG: hypothetical protein A2W09_08480 [Deltaproteobacteria bacterium RBG_16_50_11]